MIKKSDIDNVTSQKWLKDQSNFKPLKKKLNYTLKLPDIKTELNDKYSHI